MLSFSVKTFKLILVYIFSGKKRKRAFSVFVCCHKPEIIPDSCQWIFLLENRGCGKVGTLVHKLWH